MRLILRPITIILLPVLAAGCTLSDFRRSNQLDIRERELGAREQSLVLRESMADRRAANLKALDEKLQGDANADSAVNYRLGKSLYWLPEARSNSCYAAAYVPPQFKKITREVLVREAASHFIVDQAKFESRTLEVPVEYRLKPNHPLSDNVRYETAIEQLELVPEHIAIIEIDPEFTDKQVSAVKRPAHDRWKSCDDDDTEIRVGQYCVKQEPAQLHWLNREVLTGKASVIKDRKAASVKKLQVIRPTSEWLQQLTADDMIVVTEPVEVQAMVSEAKAKRALLPARSELLEVESLVQPARVEWQQVLCASNTSQLKAFQLALADELRAQGVDIDPTDNAADFRRALILWQTQKGLALSWPYLSLTSLKLLAVPLD